MTCTPLLEPTPSLARRMFDSGLESWRATVGTTLDYWGGAIARGATPLDVAGDVTRWWDVTTTRRDPAWATPNRVVLSSPVAALRDFSDADVATDVVATLVFPPQAGHHSCIVDYSAEQSQIKVIREAGLRRVWSLDWIGATPATKDASIEDYLAFVERAIAHIGGPVNLVGDCQGGWLAAIYAALHPEQVNTLTLAGAPIDFHVGEAVIHDYVRLLANDPEFYRRVVALGDGVMQGDFMLGGFIAIRPESEIDKQLQLLAHIGEPEHVERYRAFEDWFKWTQDIPGAFYLWIVENLFRDNAMIAGTLEFDGRRVDLGAIRAPLFLLAGATDHITPPAQVFATEDHVGTPAAQIVKRVTSGGHLGLFMGAEALREHWPPILAAVYEHSKPDADVPRAEGRARAATPRRRRAIPAP